jgi:hypothetical protein
MRTVFQLSTGDGVDARGRESPDDGARAAPGPRLAGRSANLLMLERVSERWRGRLRTASKYAVLFTVTH